MAVDPPYLPAPNPKVERAIGRFIIAWGALEREIDQAIHELMLTNLLTGALVTANLAMRAKLDLVHALFEQLRAGEDPVWRPVSAEWEKRFDKLVDMTAKANAEARIPIVHSQPQALRLPKEDRPLWTKMVARKGGLRGVGVSYSKEYLDERTQAVIALVHEWAEARAHWKHALHAIRTADADEWLSRSPDEEDHLTLQLQPSRGSPKANQKRPPSTPPSPEEIERRRALKRKAAPEG